MLEEFNEHKPKATELNRTEMKPHASGLSSLLLVLSDRLIHISSRLSKRPTSCSARVAMHEVLQCISVKFCRFLRSLRHQ